MTMPLLEAKGLTRVFSRHITAVLSASLEVVEGDFTVIRGASGSGKTTLLAMLGLLDAPTAGSYRVLGRETTTATEAQRASLRSRVFGFVFQSFNLMPHRTAIDNVAIGMLYSGHEKSARYENAVSALERVGMLHRANSLARNLSGGEQQRVAISRAIAGNPAVLLCDEPTGNLDSRNSAQVLNVLLDLNRSGFAVLVVTHDAVVARRAIKTFEMHDGVLSAIGRA